MPRIPTYTRQIVKRTPPAAQLDPSAAQVRGEAVYEGKIAEARGTQSLGQSVQKFGGQIYDFYKQMQSAMDANASIEAKRIIERGQLKQQQFELNNPEYTWADNSQAVWNEMDQQLGKLNMSNELRKKININSRYGREAWKLQAENRAIQQFQKNTTQKLFSDYEKIVTQRGPDSLRSIATEGDLRAGLRSMGWSDDNIDYAVENIKETATEAYIEGVKNQVEDSIRGQIEFILTKGKGLQANTVITEEDKKRAYAMVSQMVDDAVKAGTFTKGEGNEKKRQLNNQVKDIAAEFTAQRQNAEKITNLQYAEDFTDKLVSGEMKADTLAASGLTETKKNQWRPIISGTFDDPPETTVWEGYKGAMGIVFRYSENAIDKETALIDLATARYVDKSITQADYNNAVKRINTPYKKYTSKNMRDVMSEVETSSKGFKRGTKQKNAMDVNFALMEWVDDQIKEDKNPSKRDIYGIASQLQNGQSALVDLGQIITRGNAQYEIVGFDVDGEPLVERVY